MKSAPNAPLSTCWQYWSNTQRTAETRFWQMKMTGRYHQDWACFRSCQRDRCCIWYLLNEPSLSVLSSLCRACPIFINAFGSPAGTLLSMGHWWRKVTRRVRIFVPSCLVLFRWRCRRNLGLCTTHRRFLCVIDRNLSLFALPILSICRPGWSGRLSLWLSGAFEGSGLEFGLLLFRGDPSRLLGTQSVLSRLTIALSKCSWKANAKLFP